MPPIAFDVRRELLNPPTPIGVRCRAMHRTRMPEAAVQENRDTFLVEDEIRTRTRYTGNGAIHFKGKLTFAKEMANAHLNRGVTLARVVHPARDGFRTGARRSVISHHSPAGRLSLQERCCVAADCRERSGVSERHRHRVANPLGELGA